jgi:hypothetical protein
MCETALAFAGCVLQNGGVMARSLRSLLAPLGAALLCAAVTSGCSSASEPDDDPGMNGGQTGSETVGCLPLSVEALEPDQVSPIGVSPNQALAPFAARERGRVRYAASGETVGYQLVIAQAEPARFEEREWQSDGSGAEIAIACDDALVVPVTVAFDTDDGAFAERWQTELSQSASGVASISARSALDALMGSYRPSASDIQDASQVRVLFDVTLLGSTLGGSIAAQIEEEHGDAVSARELPIATFIISSE